MQKLENSESYLYGEVFKSHNMKEKTLRLKSTILFTVFATALVGCAAMKIQGIKARNAADMEQLLSAAGFKMKPADTPEKLSHLKTLTRQRLVPHEHNGNVHYVYADANFCKCLYVGDQEAYERYRKLAVQKRMAEGQMRALEVNPDGSMDWGTWGASIDHW
jgi:hypothetical protein